LQVSGAGRECKNRLFAGTSLVLVCSSVLARKRSIFGRDR
jgi:hypothetical protein